jgi:hypothetical protein
MRIAKRRWERARELDVEEVANRLGLELRNGKCSCPAHVDDTPSMTKSTRYPNLFWCYGACSSQGDKNNGAYDPLRLVETVLSKSRLEALQWLESEWHLELIPDEPGSPLREEERLPHTWIIAAMNPLAHICMENLRNQGSNTAAARQYMKSRRIAGMIYMSSPVGVIPENLDVEKLIARAKEAFELDRQKETEAAEEEKTGLSAEDRAMVSMFWAAQWEREDKKFKDFVERLGKIRKYAGYVATFYEDRFDNFIAAEFRPGDRDEYKKTRVFKLQPGRAGTFGLRVANSSAHESKPVLLCVEGWLNLLRLWTEQARLHPSNFDDVLWDGVALGSAANWDHKNLFGILDKYELIPAICYDNGEEASKTATRKLIEDRSLIAFTTLGLEAKDLDEMFDATDLTPSGVLEYIKGKVEDPNCFIPRPFESVAAQIEKIRTPRIKDFLINAKVTAVLKQDFRERGELHNGDGKAGYVFLRKEKRLIQIQKDQDDFKGFISHFGLAASDATTKHVTNQLGVEILENWEVEHFHHFAYDDVKNRRSYYFIGDGRVVRVGRNSIDFIDNGTDEVLFYDSQDPFHIDPGMLESVKTRTGLKIAEGDELAYAAEAPYKSERILNTQLYATLIVARLFPSLVPRQPCIQWTGEWGSAKSGCAMRMMRLYQGRRFHANIMGEKLDALEAALVDKPGCVFDNIDNLKKDREEKQNLIATAVNGDVAISKRKLYTDLNYVEFFAQQPPILTAMATPFQRPDVISRSIIFTLAKNQLTDADMSKSDVQFLEEFLARRDRIMAEVIVRTQKIWEAIDATEGREYPSKFRLRDFEQFTLRIADHEGWLEEARAMLEHATSKQEEEKADGDLETALLLYVGRAKDCRTKIEATKLCQECSRLCTHADIKFVWGGNPAWFGKVINSSDTTFLKSRTGLQIEDSKVGHHSKKYWFEPDQATLARAKELAKSLLSTTFE